MTRRWRCPARNVQICKICMRHAVNSIKFISSTINVMHISCTLYPYSVNYTELPVDWFFFFLLSLLLKFMLNMHSLLIIIKLKEINGGELCSLSTFFSPPPKKITKRREKVKVVTVIVVFQKSWKNLRCLQGYMQARHFGNFLQNINFSRVFTAFK